MRAALQDKLPSEFTTDGRLVTLVDIAVEAYDGRDAPGYRWCFKKFGKVGVCVQRPEHWVDHFAPQPKPLILPFILVTRRLQASSLALEILSFIDTHVAGAPAKACTDGARKSGKGSGGPYRFYSSALEQHRRDPSIYTHITLPPGSRAEV